MSFIFRIGFLCLTIAALTFAASGCNDSTNPKGVVKGTVTVGNQPLTGGKILLKSESMKQELPINVNGGFYHTNVPAGTYQVAFETESVKQLAQLARQTANGKLDAAEKEELEALKKFKYVPLADKYKKFETSGLTWTIGAGTNEKDFNLEKK